MHVSCGFHVRRQTLPLVGLTSYQALQLAGAPWQEGSNKTVVITSGAGGTGYIGVQLAKTFFAGRIVTAASPEQIPWVKSLGADVVVDCAWHWTETYIARSGGCAFGQNSSIRPRPSLISRGSLLLTISSVCVRVQTPRCAVLYRHFR